MNMKKDLLITVLAMIFAFSACGEDAETPDNDVRKSKHRMTAAKVILLKILTALTDCGTLTGTGIKSL